LFESDTTCKCGPKRDPEGDSSGKRVRGFRDASGRARENTCGDGIKDAVA
jgi:hypothetical protein